MSKFIDAVRGLNWVRLESTFGANPKINELQDRGAYRAIVAYVCGLGYSGAQGLDGFIPASALRRHLDARPQDAQHLVDVGLWHPIEGGWEVNDWHDYQPSAEQAEKRKQRAKGAAEKRWKRERASKLKAVE